MRKARYTFGTALFLSAFLTGVYWRPNFSSRAMETTALRFEANEGQTDPSVLFVSRAAGYTAFLTNTEIVLALGNSQQKVLRLKPKSGTNGVRVSGLDKLSGHTSYLIGNDPKQWNTTVSSYARVKYEQVYPGIDLVFYRSEEQLEFDFVVAPGADASVIAFDLDGAGVLDIDANGDLVIGDPSHGVRLRKPAVYQMSGETRQVIPGQYALTAGNELQFRVGAYDRSRPLVVDPVFVYSTYLGGSGDEDGGSSSEFKRADIAVDAEGNTYVTGNTNSLDFPTAYPMQGPPAVSNLDAFVLKVDPSGRLIYSTYLGGSMLERGFGIAVDDSGNAYIAGRTQSRDFPTANPMKATLGGIEDAFVAKLNATGSALVYSTYLGGTASDDAVSIAVDRTGSAYIVGETQSANFPTTKPYQSTFGGGGYDAYVAKLNEAGSALIYSTYLGGAAGDDTEDIAIDDAGNAYVVGVTSSTNFPITRAMQPVLNLTDAFVAKFDSEGSVVYATYLGGSGIEYATAVAADDSGNVYLTGITNSSDFPQSQSLQNCGPAANIDVFLSKLNSAGTSFLFSTCLGGSLEDIPYALALDAQDNIYITGTTTSQNFPIVNAMQEAMSGNRDAFVMKLPASGTALSYSTYLGGTGNDYSYAMTVDLVGNAYLTGITSSSNFPSIFPFQASRHPNDAFVMKITGTDQPFLIRDRGGVSMQTTGGASVTVGYGRIQPVAGQSVSGVEIFGFRQNGVLVTEAGVPASPLIRSGRIYIEINGPVTTGLAIANPNSETAVIAFHFTDANGIDFGHNTVEVPAGAQIARFVNEAPFSIPVPASGTMTFTTSRPVSVIALRGVTNTRQEFLITTLPVTELPATSTEPLIFPHFADGGGWSTQLVLTNPTDSLLTGSAEFTSTTGVPALVTIAGQTSSTFEWAIAPRSSRSLRTSGSGVVQVGWVRVTTSGSNTRVPSGSVIFSYRNQSFVVTETGVPSVRPGKVFRTYVESSGDFNSGSVGSIDTGVAIANIATSPALVRFELYTLSGDYTGLSGTVMVPARGQAANFVTQTPGFQSLPRPFRGILRIEAGQQESVAVVALRGRYNERRDFLATTLPAANEADPAPTTELLFPHFARGGGFTTDFILFSGRANQTATGNLRLFSQAGQPLP